MFSLPRHILDGELLQQKALSTVLREMRAHRQSPAFSDYFFVGKYSNVSGYTEKKVEKEERYDSPLTWNSKSVITVHDALLWSK